jgi:hypothetical protein
MLKRVCHPSRNKRRKERKMKTSKRVVTVLFVFTLVASTMFVNTGRSPPTPGYAADLWVNPPELTVSAGSTFSVDVEVNTSIPVSFFDVLLHFNPLTVNGGGGGGGAYPPFTTTYYSVDNINGIIEVAGEYPPGFPPIDNVKLAYVTLVCTGAHVASLDPISSSLFNPMGDPIVPIRYVSAVVTQTGIFKPTYVDYAPSGVPDFSQKQTGPPQWGIGWWKNPLTGKWSWCGPTAVANSLWWMDSRFETSITPPPTISDTFPLVQSYRPGVWDDHDPQNVQWLIANLSRYMDTDGLQTGIPHNGTEVHDMATGIRNYVLAHGLQDKFYVNLIAKPTFDYITTEVKRCEDTILLLGFWQQDPTSGIWTRIGGHFVTVPGVDSANSKIYFCDPYTDNAELIGNPGIVIPPPPHNHPAPPDVVHNNATFISYDQYGAMVAGPSPSPGGTLGINYVPGQYYDLFSDIQGQNCPHEFESMQGTWNQTWPWFTEVEYGVFMSPSPPSMYWKPGYPDYAPSGMPDFDERQWGTYNWTDPTFGVWSHCAPVAEANSLWWLDSEFESGNTAPPTISDHSKLVKSYNASWDDHDPRNVPYLIEHLAYLMDTNGNRTGIVHTGTNTTDMETGLAQYFQWSGVNPIGDVNGDGVVNATDYNIVLAAYGTTPASPSGWNMAADIYPVVLGLKADNVVNPLDMSLVTANMNKTGMFTERTVPAPDFNFIDKEVEKCEDVVLTIGFWTFTGVGWSRENYTNPYPNTGKYGHALTVAGVNSTTLQIAISDPAFDAFEAGGVGRSPVPHMHSPPEPPYTTHNNASLVSQDIYTVAQSPIPCPGGNWTIVGYDGCGAWPPVPGNVYAIIENAVVVSPVHDVAVTNVTSPKTVICQLYTGNVTVTVENHGGYTETFNVTVYANMTAFFNGTATSNTTAITTFLNVTLNIGANANLTYVWNVTTFAKGNYTLSAYANLGSEDAHPEDNRFTDRWVIVTIPGDVGVCDGKVDGKDLGWVAWCFGSYPGAPSPMTWDPNADIDNDGKVDGKDLGIVAWYFGTYDP